MTRRRHNPTEEQHQRAIVAEAEAEKARVVALATLPPDDLDRKGRLAAVGIAAEPPTLLQMINDYLQLVNIGGACWLEAKAERSRRRIEAAKAARRAALEEVVAAPGEV